MKLGKDQGEIMKLGKDHRLDSLDGSMRNAAVNFYGWFNGAPLIIATTYAFDIMDEVEREDE